MELHEGDTVMHWTHGLGQVIGVEERVLSERKMVYYAVSIRDMTVWVPDDDQLETRLRLPCTKKEFTHVLDILREEGEALPDDRQERRLKLAERLKDGQAESLCRILRDLNSFRQEHPLNDNDQSMIRQSRQMLLSEWAYVQDITALDAEKELHAMLASGKSGESKE